ncbi:hypothetical protein G9A89_015839 [Geosiphon pyriformis]|nr:hypothetical protein G9A89_015839 [Geosiphon pyriformis]
MELPDTVKNLDLPQALKNIDLPDSVKNFELPQSVRNIELPNAVKNLELPKAVKNLDLPKAVKNIEIPDAVKNIELPNALKSVPNAVSNAIKDVQLPTNATTRRLSLFATSAFSSVAFLTHKIQEKVEETTRNIQNEHDAFVKQVKEESIQPNSGTEALAPWEGLPNEGKLREQMLKLSQDKRNFLIPPPENTNFQFDLTVYYQTAMAVLNADSNLNRMRFELVPSQVQEPIFWRNYFYRISLIKQTALGSLDSIILKHELYSKNDEENLLEKEKLTPKANDEVRLESENPKEPEPKKEVQEMSIDTENADEDTWIEDELAKVADVDTDQKDDGESEIMDDWEEEMNKEIKKELSL